MALGLVFAGGGVGGGGLAVLVIASIRRALEPGQLLVQGCLVLGVADSVHDWVVDGVGLGEDRTPDGEERSDDRLVDEACHVDNQVRGPGHEPQRHGHQCHLCQLTVRRLLLCVLVSAQGLHSHFLGLLLHGFLVGSDSSHNVPVAVHNHQKWDEPDPNGVSIQVADSKDIFREVVSAACSHITLWDIAAPAKEGDEGPNGGGKPHNNDLHQCIASCKRFCTNTLQKVTESKK